MSIPFPSDSKLPQLQTLLDESQMIRILTEAMKVQVTQLTPNYVRYKPETSCIVQYGLAFNGPDGQETKGSAHIKVYADHRARTKVDSGRAQRTNRRLEHLPPHTPKVSYIPEIDGALHVFPADLDLPGLARAAERNGARRMLKKALGLDSSPTLDAEPELVRYKPGRKALFRYRVHDVSDLPLYGKVFESLDVHKMREMTDALIAAGVPTARVLGILEDRRFIVHETVPGIALKELRNSEDYRSWMKPLAEILWHLQSVDVPHLIEHRLIDEIQTLRELREQLCHLIPGLEHRLDRILEIVARGLGKVEDRLVTSHGDFYDDQALVDGPNIALIDLEALHRAHPLIDAGNMLAHLSVGAMRGDDTLQARDDFMEEVRNHFDADNSTISLFEAAGILKLAPGPFRRLEENWPARVERIVALVEERLFGHERVRPIDPALPQLSAILDVSKMSESIAEVSERASDSLGSIEMVRHKPGRRAIFRFNFTEAGVMYGKTFASKRGPKVFNVTKLISDAQAFGPDVITPAAIGYLPEHKLVLLGEVPGEPVEERLLSRDSELAARIAFALFHLHSSAVDIGRIHDLEKELAPLASRTGDVKTHAPELANDAEQLLRSVHTFDHRHLCWRHRPIHRDMYHDQILIAKNRLAILDLDDAAMSEPTVDVANFIAHLWLLGIQRHHDHAYLSTVVDAFLDQYKALDAELDHRMLNFLISSTLLRLAGIHVSRENGKQVAQMLIELGNKQLDEIQSKPAAATGHKRQYAGS